MIPLLSVSNDCLGESIMGSLCELNEVFNKTGIPEIFEYSFKTSHNFSFLFLTKLVIIFLYYLHLTNAMQIMSILLIVAQAYLLSMLWCPWHLLSQSSMYIVILKYINLKKKHIAGRNRCPVCELWTCPRKVEEAQQAAVLLQIGVFFVKAVKTESWRWRYRPYSLNYGTIRTGNSFFLCY